METNNKIRQIDLEEIVQNPIIDEFKGKTVFVTGATGLIGSEIVLSLLCANRLKNLEIKVVAQVRNYDKATVVFKKVLDNPNLEFVIQDINNEFVYQKNIDYIIHCACVTSSKEMINEPIKCIETTINGAKNILDFANKKNVSGICYLSSLEVYGNVDKTTLVDENAYGFIDLTSPRSCYPEAKRLAEVLFASYYNKYGTKTKVARLAQTFGAGITKDENRVFAQFAKSAINKKDIVLHTKGETLINYCYLTDCVIGIFYILLKGENGEAYNIANKKTNISILDMANLVAQKHNIKVKIELSDINYGYKPTIKVLLNPKKLELLGWKPKFELEQMFDRTIEGLKNDTN
jgi:dTDP-glucose 4,6-dehydratase